VHRKFYYICIIHFKDYKSYFTR